MKRNRRKFAEVDITPLIDMMFMLIIFFVLTSSFVNGKINVELPNGKSSLQSAGNAVTVTVMSDGAMLWNGASVSRTEFISLARAAKSKSVLVAADKNVSYGKVAELLSLLKKEGVTSAGLLMQNGDK